MLDCYEAKLLISMLIDGELSEDEEYKLKQHFKICKECEEEFNYINDIVKNLNELPEAELPEDFHENLMNNIKNINKVKKINWKFYSAVAAGFIILFVALDFYSVNKYKNIDKEPNQMEIKSNNTTSDIDSSYNIAAPANAGEKENEKIEQYTAEAFPEKGARKALVNPENNNTKIFNDNMILKRYDIYLEVEDYNKALEKIENLSYYIITEVKNDTESINGRIYKGDYDKFISELKNIGYINKTDITEEDKNEVYDGNTNKVDLLFAEMEKLNKEYENVEEDNIDENIKEIDKLNGEIGKYQSENYDIEFDANNPEVNINFVKK